MTTPDPTAKHAASVRQFMADWGLEADGIREALAAALAEAAAEARAEVEADGCPVHDWAEPGREAEELRKGIERIAGDSAISDEGAQLLLNLIEHEVDARDSLAYLERGILIASLRDLLTAATRQREAAEARAAAAEALLNAPEIHDFARAVTLEAAHQRTRWPSEHDAGKEHSDWFWLLGYLAGKALRAASDGNTEKALHHTISSAAALANWHAALMGASTSMRPGIAPPEALTPATDPPAKEPR